MIYSPYAATQPSTVPLLLGVNIDHVANIREARGVAYPDPLHAATVAAMAGASSITVHLREDRRHIQPRDVTLLKEVLTIPLNLECAVTDDMLQFAETTQPAHVCFVPEKREELTTEGGLDVLTHQEKIRVACQSLRAINTEVALFIEPSLEQIDAALTCEVPAVELHTGCYANATTPQEQLRELTRIVEAARYAHDCGLIVNAGHGLHYHNVASIAAIPVIHTLNIGHSIVARAVFVGLDCAVKTMLNLMREARLN